MEFRVVLGYPLAATAPSEAELERLCERVEDALPQSAARAARSAGTLEIAVSVRAGQQVDAITRAAGIVDAVVGDASIRASAQPAPCPS